MDLRLFLILFLNPGFISTTDWGDPPFTKPEAFICSGEEENINDCPYWKYNDVSSTLYVMFEEEKEDPYTIAHINCIECDDNAKLTITNFEQGSKSILGPEIKKENDIYSLIITNKLDYEEPDQRLFRFSIELDGATFKKTIKIDLIDIDDNKPTITHSPCTIKENFDGETDCIFSIYDPDTINTVDKITFDIPIENFDIKLVPKDEHNADAVLIVLEGKALDFEKNPMYYFQLTAIDGGNNRGTAQILITVEDQNDTPPRWIDIFAMQSFKEHEKQKFTVYARDGDLGINEKISYEMNCEEFNDLISLKPIDEKAEIIIKEIDRDVPELENVDNTIKCTVTAKDSIYNETANISFIIQDINDNKPIITINLSKQSIVLREEEFITLDKIFSVEDIDQGSNAQFELELKNNANKVVRIDHTQPFQIIPNNGYKYWDFSISVINATILDYDKTPDWHDFSLKIYSKDKGIEPQEDEKIIHFSLKNLNDEVPVFENINYTVAIEESAGKGTYILNIRAVDIDIGDYVEYSIATGTNDYKLDVQKKNNSVTIYTNRDNVFDYEKIQEVFIQVKAKDTLKIEGEENIVHTVSQQITVSVIDVNDENPRINLPYATEIEEHTDIEIVPIEISATDVDTDAELYFSILWNQTRASKLGILLQDITTIDKVFIIDTEYPDENKKGYANGILKINNKKLLDYETFDTILLSIRVTDKMQKIQNGIDEGILTITLDDINDNKPIFNKDSINSKKVVTEHSDVNFKIATIIATDEDGPKYNKITYDLIPIKNTKSNLVQIDPDNGDLIVTSKNIDADFPDYVEYLYYNVTATDSEFLTIDIIEIEVLDINDNIPELKKKLNNDIKIKERKSADEKTFIDEIIGFDKDRDDPHNLVSYYINNEFTQLSKTYEIDNNTGEISAFGDIEWTSIEEEKVKIYIILEDNFGGQGSANKFKSNFTITIIDIDNNPPELPKKLKIPAIKENIQKGEVISEIIATDRDKPCSENTEINYSIIELKDKNEIDLPQLFELNKKTGPKPTCEQIAEIITKESLESYFGTMTIKIRAENINTPTNFDENSYEITVNPYNFKPPKIRFPNETIIILRKEQKAGQKLILTNNKAIEDFEADDDQGNKFEMHFEKGNPWHSDFDFELPPIVDKNKARLVLTVDNPSKKEYSLQMKAKHNGEGETNNFVERDFKVKFVDVDELPFFDTTKYNISFKENQTELLCETFPPAIEPKCNGIDNCPHVTYYHIINTEEKYFFEIVTDDTTNPKICVKIPLDREEVECHYLTIYATNNPELHGEINGYEPLKITITVEDINDNPPAFSQKLFTGGLADSNNVDSTIIELIATDPDTVDENLLWYDIVKNTIEAVGDNLDSVKDKAFRIVGNKIQNLFQPTQQMRGYFTFDVMVYDSLNYSDTAKVKIDIISDANRVLFKFNEDLDNVKSKKSEIETIFTKVFKYTCIIDDFAKKENTTTRESSYITEIKTHFTNNKDLVGKEVISVKLNDLTIVGGLKYQLKDIGLTLISIEDANDSDESDDDMNLKIILPVVSVVLGTLCITLIIAFILRTRSLNRKLKAVKTNVFGSTKSDLNRIGIGAPGTNRHAIEANPVWNEDLNNETQFDNISQTSGGSDLIGVEDKPDFAYDYRRASINPVIQQKMFEQNDEHNFSYQNNDNDDINSLPGSRKNSDLYK